MIPLLLVFLLISSPAVAYHLHPYTISDHDQRLPAEEVLAHYEAQQTPRSKRFAPPRTDPDVLFWRYVVDLKRALLILVTDDPFPEHTGDRPRRGLSPGDGSQREHVPNVIQEADRLAKTIISTLYELSDRYHVFVSANVHNMVMKLGLRNRGYCYHYADDLRKVLRQSSWEFFEYRWAAAYDATWRESNALAITRRGEPFDTGIVIDSWRSGSRPYWHAIHGDRWPWKELDNVILGEE